MQRTEGSRHVGRPRDPALDHAILAATLAVLAEHGYAGFSLEAVAARAGTTKPSIARRWQSRQELIIAALTTVLVQPPVPDTGCARCDLIDGLELLADATLTRIPPAVLAPLIADCTADPELHQYLTDALVNPMRKPLLGTVAQAVERSHIRPEIDPDLLVDMLVSTVFHSSLFVGTKFDVQRAVDVVDTMLRGVAVDFAELLAHSQRTAGRHRHPD